MAIAKLITIRSLLDLGSKVAFAQAIAIMYTLAVSGTQRLLTLDQQLTLLGLSLGDWAVPTFKDNNSMPSFPFLIGL